MEIEELAERLAALERRVDHLNQPAPPPDPTAPEDVFWALEGLKQRVKETAGAVMYTGAVALPTGERYEWQYGVLADDLFADDWTVSVASLTALANPVRLLLLRAVLGGTRTTAELQEHERLGTTGQLYHHLRQLVSAGWLRVTARGRYAVPGERVVPLLAVLTAVRP
jgi:hypothetical protein